MTDHIHNSCEDIDASMFSGDYFEDAEARKKLRFYVARWLRKMAELDERDAIEPPVDFRSVGFSQLAENYPRPPLALRMFAAFNGVTVEQMPEAMRYFPNESTKKAWTRVAEATRPPMAASTSEMPDRIWAGDFNDQGFGHCVAGPQGGLYEEYIRADMVPASHDQIEDPELGIKCVDGAVCHHKCDNRCFRRDCCVPLSGYVGPWEYPDETN